MKKTPVVFLALSLALICLGCAVSGSPGSSSPATVSSPATATTSVDPTPATPPQSASATATFKTPPAPTPTIDPATVIVFEDKELERLMTRALGVSKEELTKNLLDTVGSVTIIGQYIRVKTVQGAVMGDKITSLTRFGTEYEVNGKWSKTVGKLKTLNDLVQLENLTFLEIWYQDGMNLSALPKMLKLRNLTLSNCNITDISVFNNPIFDSRLAMLDLTNNPIQDYSPLDALHFTEMHRDKWIMK